jgi:leucyl aminopeptidase
MMRALCGVIAFLMTLEVTASPVTIVRRGSQLEEVVDKVLLTTETHLLVRSPEARDEEFERLYWINLEDAKFDGLTLASLGELVEWVPDAFALLRLADDDVQKAAEVLHDERWACGQLIRLKGDEVPLRAVNKVAVPIIPLEVTIDQLTSLQNAVNPLAIRSTVEELVALGTRQARSNQANRVTDYMLKQFRKYAGDRKDVTFQTVEHQGYPQASYIVRIEGRRFPNEILVLGSHIDSINRSGKNPESAPGADDNASGTASHLELFRVAMEQNLVFDRSVEIHGYAAEELGLIGSQDIARRYVSAGKNVIAMLQNDMNLYRSVPEDMIWLVTNDVDPTLLRDTERLIQNYQTVAYDKNRLTAGTSDHRSWNRQGIPAIFPTENPTNYNRNIHTPQDVISSTSSFTQAAEFVKLSFSFLGHFAGISASE